MKRKNIAENEVIFCDFKYPKFKKTFEENKQISILNSHR